jgi:prepilin-type N-terminal cleavage/methylation domain-containing protein
VSRRAGFTLVELLIAIAIIAILSALGASRIFAPDARLFANDLRGTLEQARYEAVRRHAPVAVTWNGAAFLTRAQATTSVTALDTTICTTGTVIRTKAIADYRGISVTGGLTTNGIVWMPSGLVRTCTGADVTAVVATVVGDGRSTLTVNVFPAGAVTAP